MDETNHELQKVDRKKKSSPLIELDTVEESPFDETSQLSHYPQCDNESDDQQETPPNKRRKTALSLSSSNTSTAMTQTERNSQLPTSPVDLFQSCQLLTDEEFGGRDLLDVSNVAQLKTRLSSSGPFVANVRAAPSTLQVINKDPQNMVSSGARIHLGSSTMDKWLQRTLDALVERYS